MSQPDHWLRSMITSPERGLIVMLLLCMNQAKKEKDKSSFMNVWVKPPKLYYAWRLLRDYDPRHLMVMRESNYNIMPHGNIGNRNGTKRRKIILDNKGEKW